MDEGTLPIRVEHDKVLDEMVQQVRRVAELLREVRPAGDAATPGQQEPPAATGGQPVLAVGDPLALDVPPEES